MENGQKKDDDDLKRFYSVSEGGLIASSGLPGYPCLPDFTGVMKAFNKDINDTKKRQDINHMILDSPISDHPSKPGSRYTPVKSGPGYSTPKINDTKKRQDINNKILDGIHINVKNISNVDLDVDRRQSSTNINTNFVPGYLDLPGFTDKKFNMNTISLDEINGKDTYMYVYVYICIYI
jgi:hypothetical protein